MSAVLLAACGRPVDPGVADDTPPPPGVGAGTSEPVGTTTTSTATTTTAAAPPSPPTSRGISLSDARAAGLWGRPAFTGCVSIHGTPSPPWFDAELLAASGWPSSQWDALCRVVGCESNFEPTRVGGLGGRMIGLLQLDGHSWGRMARELGFTLADLRQALPNLRVGRALFERLAEAHGTGEQWLPSSRGGWSCASAAAG